ncbi:MAG: non-hydrolyzing UDP-N-acetylglucosamine 2-epimerase [Thermoanaerobaculia bacterium]
MQITTVVGARPQFIKAAVVSREIQHRRAVGADVFETIIHTGQHYDEKMSAVFFEEMSIPKPDFDLGIRATEHGAMVGRMLGEIERILLNDRPDLVLVYGDTNSTLAGALAAAKLQIPVAHVESGLRSFNRAMPEEINRILTDHLSAWLFCPTVSSQENLINEGITSKEHPFRRNVRVVGDVMLDAVRYYHDPTRLPRLIPADIADLSKQYCVATVHRAENTNDLTRLNSIVSALRRIAESATVVFPIHPRTRALLAAHSIDTGTVVLLPPLGYRDMLALLGGASVVLTDSGGLQKEAYFLSRPCVTLRDETEWVELERAGANFVAGTSEVAVVNAYKSALHAEVVPDLSLFGDGHAGAKIVDVLLSK